MAGTEMVSFDMSKFRVAVANIQRSIPSAMGYLRMEKGTGDWTFGTEQEPLPRNTQFAVNLRSFQKGVIAWADTTNGAPAAKLDEKMWPITAEMPDPGDPPRGSRGWDMQLGFSGKIIGGKLDGRELQYKANSDGGRRAISALMELCAEGMSKNPGCMPVISFSNRWYKHAAYGKIFAPVFEVTDWVKEPAAGEKVPAKRGRK